MSEPIFKLDLLEKYQLIDGPGTHIVAVSNTVTDKQLVSDNYPRYLVNLRVITLSNLELLVKFMCDKQSIFFKDVSKYFMTGALFKDDINKEDLPVKGEKIVATFDYVNNVLRCTNIELISRKTLPKIDLKYFDTLKSKLFNILNTSNL